MKKIRYQTKRCIRCELVARMWGGHVVKRDGTVVLAGWCSRRCHNAMQGYYGGYSRRFGLEAS